MFLIYPISNTEEGRPTSTSCLSDRQVILCMYIFICNTLSVPFTVIGYPYIFSKVLIFPPNFSIPIEQKLIKKFSYDVIVFRWISMTTKLKYAKFHTGRFETALVGDRQIQAGNQRVLGFTYGP